MPVAAPLSLPPAFPSLIEAILQNRLLVVTLLNSMASTVLGAASTITRPLRMNLALPPSMAAVPSSAAYFWGVHAGLAGGMAASFGALLLWDRAAGGSGDTPAATARAVAVAARRARSRGGRRGGGGGGSPPVVGPRPRLASGAQGAARGAGRDAAG